MPVLQTTSLSSGPGNTFGLVQYLQQRIPGYDPSEYLREIKSAYVDVWREISKLKNNYFTNIKNVTVAKQQNTFDLMFNADSGLNSVLSARLYQITRVRVQPQGTGAFIPVRFVFPNDTGFVGLASNVTASPTNTAPFLCYMQGRNTLFFAVALAIGTVLEVTYTFFPVELTYMNMGTVSSSGVTVTGNGTFFTQIVGADFQSSLPSTQGQEEVLAEIVCAPGTSGSSQSYQVKTITSDTALTTVNAIAPVLTASSPYVLTSVPEIPRAHIRVIGSLAMVKMYSVDADDTRAEQWQGIAEEEMLLMKDSLEQRQSQNPPTKGRFPGAIGRRGRYIT
jgi:hypothetical protein